jgi:coenzyme F420-0:L-glutamate ligase / coenzyme F420-1:gamma-L-glutamate ligase
VSVKILPIGDVPDVRPGDDLPSLLTPPLRSAGVRDGDVVVVTQKVVSKAEGRIAPAARRVELISQETARVVARRHDLVVAETAHGFVCANAGVDASNVDPGTVTLLPEDPDGSAERLRQALSRNLGVDVGVVVTDTFGRPWRRGVVNVAIGVAGIAPLVDLRGTPDHSGRQLEATVVAVADEIAAATGLVMTKSARVPAAIIRGVTPAAGRATAEAGRGADLIRPADEDLFRESPLEALHARRTIRSFGPGKVPDDALREAVRAACTAPAPHHTRPWRFVALTSDPARRALLGAMATAWRDDLRRDGTPEDVIARRIAASDGVLGMAPALVVPLVRFDGSHIYDDEERSSAERAMFLLSGGAAIQTLLLGLHALGIASCWISSTLFCQQETRAVLGLHDAWLALGAVACGPMPEGEAPRPRPPIDLDAFLEIR